MSVEEIKRFSDAVKGDASMQSDLKGLGSDISAITAYAKSHGYQFSEAEINDIASKEDLSDEELDKVAGGQTVVGGDVIGIGVFVSF